MHISIIHGNQYALHCEYFPLVPHYYEKSIDGSEINCKKKKKTAFDSVENDLLISQVKNHLGSDTTLWISK